MSRARLVRCTLNVEWVYIIRIVPYIVIELVYFALIIIALVR